MSSQHEVLVRKKLGKLRRNIRWMFVAHGMAKVLLAVALLLIWHFLTDTFLELSIVLRTGSLVLMGVVLLVVLLRSVVYPMTRRITDRDLALLVEREYPLLNDRLITALEMSSDSARYKNFASQELAQKVINEGFEVASRLRFKEVMQSGRLMVMTGVAVAACGLLGGLLWGHWDSTARFWVERLMLGDVEYPRLTHISVEFPDRESTKYPTRDVIDLNFQVDHEATPIRVRAARGTGLRVVAVPRGEIPDEATLILRSSRERRTFAMRVDRQESGRGEVAFFSHNIPAVLFERQEVWIEAGDAVAGPFIVEAVEAPALSAGTEVSYRFPAYMQRPDQRQIDVRGLVAPEGTTATITFSSELPLRGARVRLYGTGADPVLLDAERIQGPEGVQFRVAIEMSKVYSEYEILLTGTDGLRNTESYRYPIRTEVDQPPDVTLDFSGRGLEDETRVPMTLTGKVPLQFTVRDKYGVKLWRLMYRLPRNGDEWKPYFEFGETFDRRAGASRRAHASFAELSRHLEAGPTGREIAPEWLEQFRVKVRAVSSEIAAVNEAQSRGGLQSTNELLRRALTKMSDESTRISRDALRAMEAPGDVDPNDIRLTALDWSNEGLEAAAAYLDGVLRDSSDTFILEMNQLLRDEPIASPERLAEEFKLTGGPTLIELRIEAEDYNTSADDGRAKPGQSSIATYALMPPGELQSQISRYIRGFLKEDLNSLIRNQTQLHNETLDFLRQGYLLTLDDTDDGRRRRTTLTQAQLLQGRLPDDAARLTARFANVAQAYTFNDLEALDPERPQENAIQTVRMALQLLTAEPSQGDVLRPKIRQLSLAESDAERRSIIEEVVSEMKLGLGQWGFADNFNRASFGRRLASSGYNQPAALRTLDGQYRQLLRPETTTELRRNLMGEIAATQAQALQGLAIAAEALKKWEGFDQVREELEAMRRAQEDILKSVRDLLQPDR